MINVMITGKIMRQGIEILKKFANVKIIEEPSYNRIAEFLPATDAILHKIGKLPAGLLNLGPNIQIIARHGVGLDDLDLNYIKSKGIKLTVTYKANTNAVAEFTMGLIINLNRSIMKAHNCLVLQRCWRREELMGEELYDKKLGLIGYGDIGQRLSDIGKIFRMKILVHDPYKDISDESIKNLPLDSLLKESDIVSIHCPLNDETKNMLNKDKLSLMKKNALLINTARGGILDENTLFNMLKEKKIAGAALDVFSEEPPYLPEGINKIDNLILTSHIAAMTQKTQITMSTMAAIEIKNHFRKSL